MNCVNTEQHGPLVTVLISTYNRPRYLAEALASIVTQTWTNLDIILVRDGGLPVRDAIAEYLDDPRLTFIDRDQNRGLPYSFNEALSRARGEYVCYLGDDDKFYPFHVETLLNAMLTRIAVRSSMAICTRRTAASCPTGGGSCWPKMWRSAVISTGC